MCRYNVKFFFVITVPKTNGIGQSISCLDSTSNWQARWTLARHVKTNEHYQTGNEEENISVKYLG
jgi:hypothetical protein